MNEWRIRVENADRMQLEWTHRETELTIEITKLRSTMSPLEEELRALK